MNIWMLTICLSYVCLVLAQHRELMLVQYIQAVDYNYIMQLRAAGLKNHAHVSSLLTRMVFMPTEGNPTVMLDPMFNDQRMVVGISHNIWPDGTVPPLEEGFVETGWWRKVTSLGNVQVTNAQLVDPVTRDGVISRWWAGTKTLNSMTNDINDAFLRLMRGLSFPTYEFPASAGLVHQAHIDYRNAYPSRFSLRVSSPQMLYQDLSQPRMSQIVNLQKLEQTAFTEVQRASPPPVWDFEEVEDRSGGLASAAEEASRNAPESSIKTTAFGTVNARFTKINNDQLFIRGQDRRLTDPAYLNYKEKIKYTQWADRPSTFSLYASKAEPKPYPWTNPETLEQYEANRADILKQIQAEKTSLGMFRVNGLDKSFVTIGSRIMMAAGVAAAVAAPIFIILDFIRGEWRAAAWAIAGTIVGIGVDILATTVLAGATLAGVSVAGPIGLFVGAVVGILFAIIPGLFKKTYYAKTNNVTEIIQFAFYGDYRHTGNEKCNERLKANNQTQNCTASYGAGAIATMFKWENYDAAVFLIQMNNGYAMSIPDMAKNFTVYDYSNPSASANAMATIDCGKHACDEHGKEANPNAGACGHAGPQCDRSRFKSCAPSVGYLCEKPIFRLHRNLITLPVLNKSADALYNDVNSGECKVVSDPVEGQILYSSLSSGVVAQPAYQNISNMTTVGRQSQDQSLDLRPSYPSWQSSNGSLMDVGVYLNGSTEVTATPLRNLTTLPRLNGNWYDGSNTTANLTGLPVFIACNLTKNYLDPLTPSYNVTRLTITNSANTSTNNMNNGFVPPPAPQQFNMLTYLNSACFYDHKYPATKLCLPAGTYTNSYSGKFGMKSDKMDSLISYTSVGVFLDIKPIPGGDGEEWTPSTNFNANTSYVDDSELGSSMGWLAKQKGSITVSFDTTAPPPAGAMCLYSEADFKGDVWCTGIGGGNLTQNVANRAASVSFTPGIVAWLYPDYYGNPQGTYLSANVGDLSSIPLRTKSNFKNMVAAAWIYNAIAMS